MTQTKAASKCSAPSWEPFLTDVAAKGLSLRAECLAVKEEARVSKMFRRLKDPMDCQMLFELNYEASSRPQKGKYGAWKRWLSSTKKFADLDAGCVALEEKFWEPGKIGVKRFLQKTRKMEAKLNEYRAKLDEYRAKLDEYRAKLDEQEKIRN